MVYLDDLMDRGELRSMLDQGYVRLNQSPDQTLTIYNYTNKTMFDGVWNDVTRQCRGLIVDSNTDEIVSRPFRKFFNWNQLDPDMQKRLMKEPIATFMKWDGSLGVLYRLNTGELAIATRGSFTSVQAEHATARLREKYPDFDPYPDLTYVFEIIYPENRVVVDYQGMDDLVLLAVMETETGRTLDFTGGWPGPRTQQMSFPTLADVLAYPPEPDPEGFVVLFPDQDIRVKWKFPEYLRLHRIITNVSSLSIWEALAAGTGLEVFIDHVPDEFYQWVKETAHGLQERFDLLLQEATDDFTWIMKKVRRPSVDPKQRKEFARLATETPWPALMFGLYDGRDMSENIWKRIRPEFEKPYTNRTEDAS